jgi:glycosyltransferase involved in cell wall biosynthesis
MVTLANAFASRGIATDLVLAKKEGPYCKDVSDEVRLIDLGASRALTSLTGLVRYLNREDPFVLLSTLMYANVIAACATFLSGSRARLILREATSLSAKSAEPSSVKRLLIRLGAVWAYRWADQVIGISRGSADDLIELLYVPEKQIVVIHNPIDSARVLDLASRPISGAEGKRAFILGAGRLEPEKDFPTLLRAFARVRRSRQLELVILGEGKERKRLKALSKELGVESTVYMPGFTDNPFAYMRASSAVIVSSKREGFGNVLVEAMACGTPVVATDCQSGPAEILEGGKWGRLVPVGDDKAMADAILKTLDEPIDREALQERAQAFSPERIVPQYLDVLMNDA